MDALQQAVSVLFPITGAEDVLVMGLAGVLSGGILAVDILIGAGSPA